MDISLVVSIFSAVLVAAIGVLVVVAPRTKTTVDDAVLARLEQLESIVEGLHSTPTVPAAG
jgi:hypothetical protein